MADYITTVAEKQYHITPILRIHRHWNGRDYVTVLQYKLIEVDGSDILWQDVEIHDVKLPTQF